MEEVKKDPQVEAAYDLLNAIPEDAEKETIKEMAKKAYECSSRCLEAAVILSKCEDDLMKKEEILKKAITGEEQYVEEGEVSEALLRTVFELGLLYEQLGKYTQALFIFGYLKMLDGENVYHSNYHMAMIMAFLEEDSIKNLVEEGCDDIKLLFPLMVYYYKKSQFEMVFLIYEKLKKINPYFDLVLKGEVEEGEEEPEELKLALKVLSFNSALVNSCPGFISFVVREHI